MGGDTRQIAFRKKKEKKLPNLLLFFCFALISNDHDAYCSLVTNQKHNGKRKRKVLQCWSNEQGRRKGRESSLGNLVSLW